MAIGDVHGDLQRVKKIPLKEVDLILLNGDLGEAKMAREIAFEDFRREQEGLEEKEWPAGFEKRAFMESYDSGMEVVKYLSRFAPVYVIFGNVEDSNYETRKKSREIGERLPFLYDGLNSMEGVRVLNNRVANFRGVRVGGLEYFVDVSWVKEFRPPGFKDRMAKARKETEKARKVLKWFDKVDVLLCHQPPYGILDEVGEGAPEEWRGKHAGSKVVLDYVKRKSPKYVFCGHIHEGEGGVKVGESEVYNLGECGWKVVEF